MESTDIMTRDKFIQDYWIYYLMLEKKFIATENYVALAPENYNTFSNEYVSLLQLIGAELDAFFKKYCGFQLDEKKNISHYAMIILANDSEIKQQKIDVNNSDLVIQPFANWDAQIAKQSLVWWEAFDTIKHNRIEKRTNASLKNVLDMLGALFLLEMKYLKQISIEHGEPDIPNEESALFTLRGWKFEYFSGGDAFLKLIEIVEEEFGETK